MSIGKRLREERERLGFSQPKFAVIAATTKQTLFAWETDRTAPDAVQLSALAAVGADVLYILTGQRMGTVSNAPTSPHLKPDEAALLDNYRHSPPEAQAALKATSAALAQRASGKSVKRRA